jgi:hypothetical protein
MLEHKMENKEFKVGDEVLVIPNNGPDWISKVVKVTPTGRVRIENSSTQFSKEGYQIGNSIWDRKHIKHLTSDDKAKIARDRLILKLRAVDWSKYSTEKLTEVFLVINENKKVA